MRQVIAASKKYLNRYKIDVLIFAAFVLTGVIFASKPDVEIKLQQTQPVTPLEQMAGQSEAKSLQLKEETSKQKNTYKYSEKRNIFSLDGSYELPKDLIQIPENPYNLIAVLKGKEKRAVFREFTGNVVSLKIGSRLIDGATITDIGEMTVKVKKGRDIKEFRIFEVKGAVLNKETKGGRR